MWKDLLYVGLGGGIGSIARYLTSHLSTQFFKNDWFFMGTFTVNILGCFLIGLLSGWLLAKSGDTDAYRVLFIVGFCGGFTTFSTFANENLKLFQSGNYFLLASYLTASIVLGIAAVWLGMRLVK